eukprot:117735-Lingulodinium_polyedra.AAC.1
MQRPFVLRRTGRVPSSWPACFSRGRRRGSLRRPKRGAPGAWLRRTSGPTSTGASEGRQQAK